MCCKAFAFRPPIRFISVVSRQCRCCIAQRVGNHKTCVKQSTEYSRWDEETSEEVTSDVQDATAYYNRDVHTNLRRTVDCIRSPER
jgi:hypothetical protein